MKKLKAEHELVGLGENTSFAVREFKLPRFTSPWHLHSEYELTLILSGTGKRFVGDHVSSFAGGDLVLIGADLPHYWGSARHTNTSHSLVIQFSENCLGDRFFDQPEMKPIKSLLIRSRRGIRFTGKVQELVSRKMPILRKATGVRRIQEFISILDALATSKEYRLLAGESFTETVGGWQDKRINTTCQYVFDHIAEDISLKDLSHLAGMSPEAFCRFFKKTTRQPLFTFINRTRISHTCSLLIDTTMSISEACYASGFNNLSNFNRRFRSIKGLSPRQFRTQFQTTRG